MPIRTGTPRNGEFESAHIQGRVHGFSEVTNLGDLAIRGCARGDAVSPRLWNLLATQTELEVARRIVALSGDCERCLTEGSPGKQMMERGFCHAEI